MITWIKKLFGDVDKDIEAKVVRAALEGEYQALAQMAALCVSRMATLKPDQAPALLPTLDVIAPDKADIIQSE